jgi:FkbM family methyltransferase
MAADRGIIVVAQFIKLFNLLPSIPLGLRSGWRENPLTYVDIGGRGGLPPRWKIAHSLGLIRPIFFEPEKMAAIELQKRYPKAVVETIGLGDKAGSATLYLTRDKGRSSVLRPLGIDILGDGGWEVRDTTSIKIQRMDTVWKTEWGTPTFVKIDVQGYELNVLDGIGRLLDDVLGLELEVSLQQMYHGQPVLQKVYDQMYSRGFRLVKLKPQGLFKDKNLIEFNSFFVRDDGKSHQSEIKFWKIINDVGDAKRVNVWGY